MKGSVVVGLLLAASLLGGCRLSLQRPREVAAPSTGAPTQAAAEPASDPSLSLARITPAFTAPLGQGRTQPATATPTPTHTLTPTATSTPTPSPTPTIPPSARLAEGVRQQLNGDTVRARREFAALIAGDPLSPEAHEARYRLAETYLADEAYDEAVAALLAYLDAAPPDDPRRNRAYFLLARGYEGAGAWDAAIAAYEKYLAGSPLLSNEVRERIAKAQAAKGDRDGAIATYEELLKSAPADAVARWREALALLYVSKGETDRALAQYDALLNAGPSGYRRAQLHLLAAQALDAAGRKSEAHRRRLLAVQAEPRSSSAYTALVALVDAGVPVDDYLRGVVDYYAGAITPAINALRRHIASDPEGGKGEAHYYLGKCYMAQGQWAQAIAALDRVIKQYPQIPQWGDAWLDKAAAQARAGDVAAARATYRRFAASYPDHRLAPQALRRAAQLREGAKDYRGAAQDLLALRQTFPASAEAAPALLRAGIHLYRVGDYAAAAEAFQDLATNYPSSDLRPAALFWWGKSLLAAGDVADATEPWARLRAVEPNGFYTLRAEALGPTPAPKPKPPPDDQEAAEAWLRGWTGETATGETLRTLPSEIADDPAFRRGREMLALGLTREGLAELEKVRTRWQGDPIALYRLSLAFREVRAYRLSLLCAARLIALSPARNNLYQAPGFLLRLAYPRYYADLVETEAAAQQIDVWLLYALIRQESLFEETATSSANARGLTQVIPSTGEWIAGQLGWRHFSAELLYRPYISVRFGAYYLARALAGFNGDRLMALAGYNGGPGNAQAWRQRSGPDDDLFVADIGARESQVYVRSVMAQQAIYRWLYSSPAE